MEVDFLQPRLDIKARAGFLDPWQVSVTYYLSIGIVEDEAVEEVFQRLLLGRRASVGRLAVLVETALVADADAVGVVETGMCSYLILRAAWVDHAILGNVKVVADGTETTCLVAGFQGFYWEVLIHTSGTAMYHDEVDFSWILHNCNVEC